jgi:hypothetical protein
MASVAWAQWSDPEAWRRWGAVRPGHELPNDLKAEIAENAMHPPGIVNPNEMGYRVFDLAGRTEPVYVVDTRLKQGLQSRALCGWAGCAFLGYVAEDGGGYRRVLDVYLSDRYLPNRPPLSPVETTGAVQNGLPCLVLSDVQRNGQISAVTWCYDGQSYVPATVQNRATDRQIDKR